jgi:hypothetical protein
VLLFTLKAIQLKVMLLDLDQFILSASKSDTDPKRERGAALDLAHASGQFKPNRAVHHKHD